MEPELSSIQLDMVTDTSTLVKITYRAPAEFKGIELMGVDAKLSWVKGQSINLKQEKSEEDVVNYTATLEVADSCEFRARGYDEEGDRWEAGLSNHRIDRNDDGSIEFTTELDSDLYYFKGSLPTDMEPSLEEVEERIRELEERDVPLYQSLVDLSVWIDQVYENPQSEDYIYPLSGIMRHLKRKSRAKDSKKVDEVVRPINSILFKMYREALDFHEEDIRYLTGMWLKNDYIATIKNLPEEVEKLENDIGIGKGKDSWERFQELLKFVS